MTTLSLEQHFGLTRPPFPRAVPADALLDHPALAHVLARLRFALERDTIALLCAESGCGKSTVLSLFAHSLDAATYHVLATSLTTLGPFSLLSHFGTALGLRGRRFKGETAAALLMHLRSQPRRTVILVDEAHLLPDSSLEDLRLLTADDLDRRSPFSLVLVGQPILRDRITEPQHYALWQRIGVRLRLRPLTEAEIPVFLDRHLQAAGAKKQRLFAPDAVAEIFHHSRGIPRLIQNLALDAMLAALAAGKDTVDADAVSQAVVDMEAA
jgi:type II secretory pathway predicted ATPase ExeA